MTSEDADPFDVPLLAEERDRRKQGNGAIRSALREPADRTWGTGPWPPSDSVRA
jgi:hypothetical protein